MEVALKKNNANFEVDLNKLDVSQKDAVVSQESNVVIRASAGSGKTFTLINAIANHRFNLEVVKVKAHSNNKFNQYVDLLAVKRRKELED